MRILCDQYVPEKYLQALEAAGITVSTVEDALAHDAPDAEIVAYAEANDWVVFTNDEDFYAEGGEHGLLFYSQLEDPTPGAVVEAVQRIEQATSRRPRSRSSSPTDGRDVTVEDVSQADPIESESSTVVA